MIIELLDSKDFSKWVGQVLLSVDLLKVDVTLIYDLLDKVVAVQNMLSTVMRL